MFLRGLVLIISTAILGSCIINAQEECAMDSGCRIFNGKCSCAYGCVTEYRYKSHRECQAALKGRRNDICTHQPCQNGGSCIQTSQDPGFKCRCDGTGYYGMRCDRACPTPGAASQYGVVFPYECVEI